jgi:hypothetical protein
MVVIYYGLKTETSIIPPLKQAGLGAQCIVVDNDWGKIQPQTLRKTF